ncbi:SDR family oxidoreductase [Microbacterium sp. zg-Y818]|uniref:SDR family NAD(P)-dependent oxidoreductase n=1 Tax=unclassified Microbacterium TaxID=2609290 RepID=UPI00214C5190|nr:MULTISPECIES: SDR family oxidoreductase [unclassified Microbacterium]MCR2799300.1 SDR family oxidoreductase [Microbacterium sp. zg.Y818]WIM21301.1 SDR family oxidoreductase [Microbacterium sp. zg-Y818]
MTDILHSQRLQGLRVVVAGGGGAIGAPIALACAAQGARVVVADISEKYAQETVDAIVAAGGEAHAVPIDVGDLASIDAGIDAAKTALGGIDALVNSTGVSGSANTLDVTEEHWDRIHTINLKGAFFLIQAAARVMAEQGEGGAIVTITSTNAERGVLGHVPYGGTKGALRQMVFGLAADLAEHNIRVNNVGPGMMATTMRNDGESTERTHVPRKVLRRRLPTGADVAKMVTYLLSDEGEYVTATNLYVDGGALSGLF